METWQEILGESVLTTAVLFQGGVNLVLETGVRDCCQERKNCCK